MIALVLTGVNDILSAEGASRAACLNRIPIAAWLLVGVIAMCRNFLIGFTARRPEAGRKRLLVLPVLVAIAFLRLADIDNPDPASSWYTR